MRVPHTARVLAVLCLAPATLLADVLHVPDDYASLGEAIAAAASGDTILVAKGVYAGPSNRDLRFWGKNIVLVSEDGPAVTIIDCGNADRAFQLLDGESEETLIDGFTIVRGYGRYGGGGMYIQNASPVVRRCVFSQCYVEGWFYDPDYEPAFGGGVYCEDSDALIENCTFVANEVDGGPQDGSGVAFAGGSPSMLNCLFACGIGGNPFTVVWGQDPEVRHCIATGGYWTGDNMLVEDAGFCDWPRARSHFLCSDSPALPENNLWGELVGALGVGCGPCVTAVEHVSWGAIKAMYRGRCRLPN